MTIKWKSKIILFKLESEYGTDPTPTGGANAILVNNAVLTPMEGEDVNRDLEQPWLSADPMIPTGLRGRLTGRIELAPSGTAGTAPAWGPILRALGCAETIVSETSVTYNPVSDDHESGTLYFYIGDTLHELNGCRGTGVLRFPAQGIPYLEFDLLGLWVTPTEGERPTADLSGFEKPLIVTNANTPTFTINSVSLVMRECSLNLGNQVVPDLLVNSEDILISDRAETLAARVRAVPVSTLNPYALAQAQTSVAVSLVHGNDAGSIATLAAAACQMKRPSGLENSNNITEWPLELVPLPSSGNDQWSLALT